MGIDFFEVSINMVKIILIFFAMIQTVPVLVWLERRGSAFIQNRLGPNRVGPLGLTQLLADAVKFFFKQEFVPGGARRALFYSAPVLALVPAAIALGAIPLSLPVYIEAFESSGRLFGPYRFAMQGYEIGVGIVFILGISSLATYSVLMAGWSSGNKYSLMGALRASAQMISYELSLGLSLVGCLLIYGTFDLNEIVSLQTGPLLFSFFGKVQEGLAFLPNWGVFYQPLGALLFFVATFAECHRLPFDLPEAEGELVAGFHTEYSGVKMLLFFIGEYGHMIVSSALLVVFFFGGYDIPWFSNWIVSSCHRLGLEFGLGLSLVSLAISLIFLLSFLLKVALTLWIFIWIRWSLPRFRYDQLMNLGWKKMLPWALFNTVLTAIALLISQIGKGV